MAPERSAHALTKDRYFDGLPKLSKQPELPCTVYPDGMAVEIDAATT